MLTVLGALEFLHTYLTDFREVWNEFDEPGMQFVLILSPVLCVGAFLSGLDGPMDG